jgi:hypothetical protein
VAARIGGAAGRIISPGARQLVGRTSPPLVDEGQIPLLVGRSEQLQRFGNILGRDAAQAASQPARRSGLARRRAPLAAMTVIRRLIILPVLVARFSYTASVPHFAGRPTGNQHAANPSRDDSPRYGKGP